MVAAELQYFDILGILVRLPDQGSLDFSELVCCQVIGLDSGQHLSMDLRVVGQHFGSSEHATPSD